MPKKVDIKMGVRLDVYVYMCEQNITYEKGAEIFGFNSKQAFHAWIHSKHDQARDESILKKFKEITK
jgi:hypothetical protein